MENSYERCEPDDPNRCQAVNAKGQCQLKAMQVDGVYMDNCIVHGGNIQAQSYRKKSADNYRLTKWRARIQGYANAPEVKSLREEIGILRMLLEEKLSQCETNLDLVLNAHTISDLVTKVDKTVNSCHKIEGSMGQLLDKQSILQFANEVITIVAKHCDDPDAVDQIANEILGAMSNESS